MKAFYSVPFDAPVRLPPPSYMCSDGVERPGVWVDFTYPGSTDRTLLPSRCDPSDWCVTYATK